MNYFTLDISTGSTKPTTHPLYISSLVVLVTYIDHTPQMWLGPFIKYEVPVITGILYYTRSHTTHILPTNWVLHYLGISLEDSLLSRAPSHSILRDDDSVSMLHTRRFILYCQYSRVFHNTQLFEGTRFFLFPSTIPGGMKFGHHWHSGIDTTLLLYL